MTTDHIPDAGKMMPAALRLADHLERFRSFPDDLAAAAELRRLHTENEATDRQVEILTDELGKCSKENAALKKAITKLHTAKGRYHTQLAICDLFDLVGLPNERPKK